jgi:hypothetical protein
MITAIAVDGANRKWIGTRNSGVYLVSETGEKEVLHFTLKTHPAVKQHYSIGNKSDFRAKYLSAPVKA